MARPERVEILDEHGNPTGNLMTLTGTNLTGEWHAGVHVALYTRDRRVVLQQRSKAIIFNPGKWELGAGGVVGAGESIYEAAFREVEEEIGATPHNLQAVTRWKYNHHLPSQGMHAKVFLYSFIAEVDPAHFTLQKGEVDKIRLLPVHAAHDAIFNHKGLPHIQLMPYQGYYRQLLAAIEQALKNRRDFPDVATIKEDYKGEVTV